jgi:hypothetical protein
MKSREIFPLEERNLPEKKNRIKVSYYKANNTTPTVDGIFYSFEDYIKCYKALEAAEAELLALRQANQDAE